MAVRLSTGFRNLILGDDSFRTIFDFGVIHVYTGAQPVSADNAVSGTLLGKVTVDGEPFTFGSPDNGLQFAAPEDGIISKVEGDLWQLIGEANGNAGWGRLMGNALDALGSSETLPRIDFSIGTSGADLILNNVAIATGARTTIDTFRYRILAQN